MFAMSGFTLTVASAPVMVMLAAGGLTLDAEGCYSCSL